MWINYLPVTLSSLGRFCAGGLAALFLASGGRAEAKSGGIALSDRFRFYPSLQLEFRYDTNVFTTSSSTGAPILRIIPKVEIGTPDPNSIGLTANFGVDWLKYFGQEGSTVSLLSTLALTSDLDFVLNPNGAFAFGFVNAFRRTNTPSTSASSEPVNRIYDQVGPRFVIQPGGRALSVEFGYFFSINRVEASDTGKLPEPVPDYNQHSFRLQGKWKFFEKTAALIDFDMAILEYVNGSTLVGGMPLKTALGLVGQLTSKIAVVLKAGYGNSLSSSGPSFSSFVGGAEGTFKPTTTISFTAGYQRDFVPANGWGNYFDTHHPYLKFSWLLFQRLNFGVEGNYQKLTFSNNPTNVTGYQNITTQRVDDLFQVAVNIGIDIKDWLKIMTGTQIELRRSNVTVTTTSVPPTSSSLDYTKVQVFLNLLVGY